MVNFSLGGDLTEYGVKSPWANDGVGVSIGAEYRRETLDYAADYVTAFEDVDGLQGGFIWEWCDHGLRRLGGGFLYGGDVGEGPHDANFCCDGLVSQHPT